MAFDWNKGTIVNPTSPKLPSTSSGGFDWNSGKTVTPAGQNNFPQSDPTHQNFLQKVGNGLTSSEQTLGKGLSTVFDRTTQKTVSDINQKENQGQQSIIDAIHTQTDPTKKQGLIDYLKRQFNVTYQAPTAEQLNPGFGLSNKQVLGAAGGVGLDVLAAGSYGKAASAAENTGKLVTRSQALSGLLDKAGISSVVSPTEQVAKSTVKPALSETLKTIGKKTAITATEGAGTGYAYDVTQAAQQNKDNILKPGGGTWAGAALPVAMGAFEAGRAIGKEYAPRIINSLVSPSLANFSYGKNPGRTVSEMGITGNNLQEFGNNITQAKQEVGQKIGTIISSPENAGEIINATPDIQKIDEAIAEAAKGGKNNQSIVTTLQNVKDALLYDHTVTADGTITKASDIPRDVSALTPEDAFQLKQDIAGMTRFTGNASDDKAVNATLKSIYGGLKDSINTAVAKNDPEIEKLNQQYADLTSAELAVQHRNNIVQRSNLINPLAAVEGTGGAVAGLMSGGPVGAAIGGMSGIALNKALGSTAVKTRVASWLAAQSPEIIQKLAPDVKEVLIRTFPKLAAQTNQTPNK